MKLYSDRSLCDTDSRHVVLLYPFWGKNAEHPGLPNSSRYDDYMAIGDTLFSMTSLSECDVAVFPVPWEDMLTNPVFQTLAASFAEEAAKASKKTCVFFWHDLTETVSLQNCMVIRTSVNKSRQQANEQVMPAWSEDFLQCYLGNHLVLRQKGVKPTVGFCGATDPLHPAASLQLRNTCKRLANAFGCGEHDLSRSLRSQALNYLYESPEISANFILRDRFLGRTDGSSSSELEADRLKRVRREYVDNMVESDYVLCMRGAGNFSYRLYETLSCGRIPIFVNTDCSLPFENWINYKDYFVWVEEGDLTRISDIVAAHYSHLTQKNFLELQHECRRLWETYLSPTGYFSHFYTYFS